MDITGGGITPFSTYVKPDFLPVTKLAIKWRKLASGNWSGLDRTSSEDTYEANCTIYGTEATINTFIDEISANMGISNNVITLDSFLSTEYIFGENVDHSGTIDASVVNIGPRIQNTWKGWSIDIVFRATSVSFTGGSSLPTLDKCEIGVQADSDWTITTQENYDGTLSYQDHFSDIGTFNGIFTLSKSDAILLRNYIKTQRTGDFTLADTFGIDYPFGTRSSNSYPYTTKLIGWEDLGAFGTKYQKFSLTFAEVD